MSNYNNSRRRNPELKSLLRKIPGFRSNIIWKKIAAIIIYSFLAIFIISALAGGGILGLISFLTAIAFFISIAALVKGKLLLFKIPNRKIAGIILVASILLIFILPSQGEDIKEEADLKSSDSEIASDENEVALNEKKAEEEKAKKAEEQKLKEAEEKAKAQEAAAAKKEEEERRAKEAVEKAKANAEQEAKEKAEAEQAVLAKADAEKKKKENAANATVIRVVDGDTLEISMDGKTETVRLLLVDTPETVHPQKPVEPYGPEASQFVKDTLQGKEVRVQVGEEERDNYGRMLAYVFIGDETIQEKLLKNGLAATAYLYNDLSMLDQFHKAQQTAIDAGKGVWSIPGYAHVDHDHGFHYEEEAKPEPESAPAPEVTPRSNLQYDPAGPDRDCGDFSLQASAQAFMDASGPSDPHRLDGNDNDGLACESLP